MREQRSAAWWRLEQLDRHAADRRLGAMHLSGVFRRSTRAPGYRGRFDAGA
jgi:hypothetical protein